MSTRVFKPISMTEMPKHLSSPILDGKLNYKGVHRVRRSLFNPDPEETKRFLKEEFAKLTADECDKWDFDFIQGIPRKCTDRFEWTIIAESPKLDVMIRPIKRYVDVEDFPENLYPPIESSSESIIVEDQDEEMSTSEEFISTTPVISRKQSLITDFMQVRKRIEERSSKKAEITPRPHKKARISLVDSAS